MDLLINDKPVKIADLATLHERGIILPTESLYPKEEVLEIGNMPINVFFKLPEEKKAIVKPTITIKFLNGTLKLKGILCVHDYRFYNIDNHYENFIFLSNVDPVKFVPEELKNLEGYFSDCEVLSINKEKPLFNDRPIVTPLKIESITYRKINESFTENYSQFTHCPVIDEHKIWLSEFTTKKMANIFRESFLETFS